MKKIAFVINSIHPGGPSYVVRNIIKNLDYSEYKVFLITLFAENAEDVVNEQKDLGVTVFECDFPGRMYALTKGQKVFEKIIVDNGIQIVHSHGFIPDIMSGRLKNHNLTRISTIHCNMYDDYPAWYGKLKGNLYIITQQHYLRKLTKCAAVSQYVYDSVSDKLSNLVLVRNGIGKTVIKKTVLREDLSIPEEAIVFIYAGQLRSLKNSVWMIEEFKKFHSNNEYLVVLGRGSDKDKCAAIVDDHIIHYGFTDNPYAFMRISDVYISASFAEGFSISVLEAMDNGLMLFLSDIPSHLEVFKTTEGTDLYLGETFVSGDEQSFHDALNVLRKNYGKINKGQIIKHKDTEMSVDKMIRQYTKLYQNQD